MMPCKAARVHGPGVDAAWDGLPWNTIPAESLRNFMGTHKKTGYPVGTRITVTVQFI
jgi:hypothetical protein